MLCARIKGGGVQTLSLFTKLTFRHSAEHVKQTCVYYRKVEMAQSIVPGNGITAPRLMTGRDISMSREHGGSAAPLICDIRPLSLQTAEATAD